MAWLLGSALSLLRLHGWENTQGLPLCSTPFNTHGHFLFMLTGWKEDGVKFDDGEWHMVGARCEV